MAFRLTTEEIQNKLSQHLSFIHSVKETVNERKKERINKIKSEKSTMGQLKQSVARYVKSAVKKATRTASSVRDKVDNSTSYVSLMRAVLEKAQIFERWISETEKFSKTPATGKNVNGKLIEEIHKHFLVISEFFYTVVCNIIIRDLRTILKRYVKHCTRSMAP